MAALTAWSPQVRSVLRIVAGLMFMLHGTQKMFGFPDAAAGPMNAPLMSKGGISGVLEVVLGALIVIGLLTRFAAFLASGEMAVAYFTVHAPNGFWPTMNKGELAALYCFLFFYFFFAGAGPWSIDALIDRARAKKT